ncbi:MAG TPA: hypothetical protein VFI24_07035 [Pyrinomonadaceae bacterium]|nr:hypothetical protein [Pyrinomonadaceae bacterium]
MKDPVPSPKTDLSLRGSDIPRKLLLYICRKAIPQRASIEGVI